MQETRKILVMTGSNDVSGHDNTFWCSARLATLEEAKEELQKHLEIDLYKKVATLIPDSASSFQIDWAESIPFIDGIGLSALWGDGDKDGNLVPTALEDLGEDWLTVKVDGITVHNQRQL
jgi:hypothetical protein